MTGWDDDVRAMVQICPDDNLCSGLVLPCLQPLSIHGSNERLQISASSTCPLKKNNTLLKHGTIPFNTFFFFLMVQIGQLVHLWYFLIDGGKVESWRIPTLKKKKEETQHYRSILSVPTLVPHFTILAIETKTHSTWLNFESSLSIHNLAHISQHSILLPR